MPLPQQVINQLGQEPPKTPGWSSGIMFFSGAIFVIVLVIYFGLTLAYTPYLNNKANDLNNQISTASQAISSNGEANLVNLYSQVSNLQSTLRNHILFSQFLSWLQANTEANVYYTQFSFTSASGDEVTLAGSAENEADVNQQIAIFQASPEVSNVSISNVAIGTGGLWQFSATLVMNPSLFTAPN
jgi:hypothetical protein